MLNRPSKQRAQQLMWHNLQQELHLCKIQLCHEPQLHGFHTEDTEAMLTSKVVTQQKSWSNKRILQWEASGCIYLSSSCITQMLGTRCNLSPRLAHMGHYVSEHLPPSESMESHSEEWQFNTAGSQCKPRKDAVRIQDSSTILNLFRTPLIQLRARSNPALL